MNTPDLEEVPDFLPASRTMPVYSEPGLVSAYDYGDHFGVHYGYAEVPIESLCKAFMVGHSLGYTMLEHGDEGFISLVRPVSKTEGTDHANR